MVEEEEDENYADQVYQKQLMFIQTMKQTLKESDFQNDWLMNDPEQVDEENHDDGIANKFSEMNDLELVMDGILAETEKGFQMQYEKNFCLNKLIKEI